jgi:2,3-dihydroxyphenylpropionate 1,2-dioxygenase
VVISTVLGGALLPHAPQFFTMPETEDVQTVQRVRGVAANIGARLRELKPDLWVIFSNDHAEQFFHNAAPPFTVHVGGEANGEFAGRKFTSRFPARSGSSWFVCSTIRVSIRRSPARRRSTMRWESR